MSISHGYLLQFLPYQRLHKLFYLKSISFRNTVSSGADAFMCKIILFANALRAVFCPY
ncbi:hypothetical protein HMPREF0495_01126 [Levilactobacillus brevis ATCC 14869 = DSM 20054]|uniref:Uncharacterized protein n=1 Tax=Levilactobacillus brevis ATCC 14869 = DSM 20054 TaxID=649758 RepID=U2QZE4_LEVBR|nr:hypothetical protein HMPREF0495_01126 [Levilactobacillus brevis ATCC 14869 = DSM 20054]